MRGNAADEISPARSAAGLASRVVSRVRLLSIIALIGLIVAPPSVLAAHGQAPGRSWLDRINAVRAAASLAPVGEVPEWSAGGALHSRYMVKNNYVGHDEDTSNPWYTPEGRAAGQNGNAYAAYDLEEGGQHGIDAWLTTPFHLINVLDPRLRSTGFGWYREGQPGDRPRYQVGATLDVARGLDPERGPLTTPVFFPSPGQMMPYDRYFGSEYPDPLTSCADRAFMGAPIVVQLPATPWVTAVTVEKDGLRLDRCVFDESTYANADEEAEAIGRDVLARRHGVVILPREPLTAGVYRVSLTTAGVTYSWAFAGPAPTDGPDQARPDAAVLPFSASTSGSPFGLYAHPDTPISQAPAVAPRPVAGCSPRPEVGVTVVRDGEQRVLAMVAARGPSNELRQLHFGSPTAPLENAAIELNGYPAPIVGPGTVTLPPGTSTVAFAIQRLARGRPLRVPLTVTDGCGDWTTVLESPGR